MYKQSHLDSDQIVKHIFDEEYHAIRAMITNTQLSMSLTSDEDSIIAVPASLAKKAEVNSDSQIAMQPFSVVGFKEFCLSGHGSECRVSLEFSPDDSEDVWYSEGELDVKSSASRLPIKSALARRCRVNVIFPPEASASVYLVCSG